MHCHYIKLFYPTCSIPGWPIVQAKMKKRNRTFNIFQSFTKRVPCFHFRSQVNKNEIFNSRKFKFYVNLQIITIYVRSDHATEMKKTQCLKKLKLMYWKSWFSPDFGKDIPFILLKLTWTGQTRNHPNQILKCGTGPWYQ